MTIFFLFCAICDAFHCCSAETGYESAQLCPLHYGHVTAVTDLLATWFPPATLSVLANKSAAVV